MKQLLSFLKILKKMKISIKKIPLEEKNNLNEMIFVYQKELLNKDNPSQYKYLDSYWQDINRYPFYVLCNEVVVGFALVNDHSLFKKNAYNFAEFFIEKKHRKNGIGKKSAIKVFTQLKGDWEVRVMEENKVAQNFWKNTVNSFSTGKYKEMTCDDNRWKGSIFTFSTNDN